jgi:hypothetical protein
MLSLHARGRMSKSGGVNDNGTVGRRWVGCPEGINAVYGADPWYAEYGSLNVRVTGP